MAIDQDPRDEGGRSGKRKRRKSALVTRIEYAVFRMLVRSVRGMSDQRLDVWSRRIGDLAARVLASRNRLAATNLAATLPDRSDEERERIRVDCWRHYARSILDYFRCASEDSEAVAGRLTFGGANDAFFASVAAGPSLILFAHYGNWEMATYLALFLDRDITAVARKLDNPLIDRDLVRSRERSGLSLLDRRKAARGVMRALENGDLVAMVVDQAVKPREGILVPFLGRPAWTTTAPARFAMRYDIPIWCVHVVAENGAIAMTFDGPIRAETTEATEASVAALTERVNDRFSARILERPELWLWMHDRWKGAPKPS
jgi:KDO2-lipid IV(A) lauroyltransferase